MFLSFILIHVLLLYWTKLNKSRSSLPCAKYKFFYQPQDSPEKDQTKRVATKRLLKHRNQIEKKDKWSMNICDREEEPPHGNRAAVKAWHWCRNGHIPAASHQMRDKPHPRQCSGGLSVTRGDLGLGHQGLWLGAEGLYRWSRDQQIVGSGPGIKLEHAHLQEVGCTIRGAQSPYL